MQLGLYLSVYTKRPLAVLAEAYAIWKYSSGGDHCPEISTSVRSAFARELDGARKIVLDDADCGGCEGCDDLYGTSG